MPWKCPTLYPKSRAFIIANGPSVTAEDVERLRGQFVITVNRGYLIAPWADILLINDCWIWYHYAAEILTHAQNLIVSLCPRAYHERVKVMERTGKYGIETARWGLRCHHTVVHGACNIAVHGGAREIVLLGCDFGIAENGAMHFCGSHKPEIEKGRADNQRYAEAAAHVAGLVKPLADRGVQLINATRGGNLQGVPRRSLDSLLSD